MTYYIAHLSGGLGNQMFNIASIYGQSLRDNVNFGIMENQFDWRETKKTYNGEFMELF